MTKIFEKINRSLVIEIWVIGNYLEFGIWLLEFLQLRISINGV